MRTTLSTGKLSVGCQVADKNVFKNVFSISKSPPPDDGDTFAAPRKSASCCVCRRSVGAAWRRIGGVGGGRLLSLGTHKSSNHKTSWHYWSAYSAVLFFNHTRNSKFQSFLYEIIM